MAAHVVFDDAAADTALFQLRLALRIHMSAVGEHRSACAATEKGKPLASTPRAGAWTDIRVHLSSQSTNRFAGTAKLMPPGSSMRERAPGDIKVE